MFGRIIDRICQWPEPVERVPHFFRSYALISRVEGKSQEWLCVRDKKSGQLDFVHAIPEPGSSFRDAIDYEVSRALGVASKHLLVANMAQIHLELVTRLPALDADHHIGVAFYVVTPYGHEARSAFSSFDAGVWLSGRELHLGKSCCGGEVDANLVELLHSTEVIPTW